MVTLDCSYRLVKSLKRAIVSKMTGSATLLKGDGYFIASLYDLGSNAAGVQNGTGSGAADYPALVDAAVNTTAWYADQDGISDRHQLRRPVGLGPHRRPAVAGRQPAQLPAHRRGRPDQPGRRRRCEPQPDPDPDWRRQQRPHLG